MNRTRFGYLRWGRRRHVVAALLFMTLPAAGLRASPVDPHIYAEDTAREVAALVKPGTILVVDAPDGYYALAVVAQLKARGFVVTRFASTGMPVRFTLVDDDRRSAARVDLAVGTERLWRTFDPRNGRPSHAWTRQVVTEELKQTIDEPAQLFQLGRIVESRSAERAMRYYRLAADLGNAEAALRLGLMLISAGKAEEGLRYVSVASDAGVAQAQYVLGLAYLNGTGIAKDAAHGKALLRLAANAGIAAAGQALGTGALTR